MHIGRINTKGMYVVMYAVALFDYHSGTWNYSGFSPAGMHDFWRTLLQSAGKGDAMCG